MHPPAHDGPPLNMTCIEVSGCLDTCGMEVELRIVVNNMSNEIGTLFLFALVLTLK